MGKYRGWRNAALFCAGIVLFISSCTEVDNTVGDSLIPDHQQMKVARMTVAGIDAYQARVDSFIMGSGTIPFGMIGSTKSPVFGVTYAAWMSQFVPLEFNLDDNTFGENPVADSLVLYLSFANYYSTGDTSKVQRFNIYRVTERFYWGSMYYLHSDDAVMDPIVAGFIDPEPISTFESTPYCDTIRHRLTGPKAEEIMQLLLNITEDHFANDSTFVDNFYGLYIAPQPGSPEDAATLAINMSSSYLRFHTHHVVDPSVDPDNDTVVYATYTPDFTTSSSYLASFNVYKHDYTGTPLDHNPAVNDFEHKISVGYLQGAGGVTVLLNFNTSFIEALKNKIVYGEDVPAEANRDKEREKPNNRAEWEYKTMAVHGAKLSIPVHNPDNDNAVLNRAFSRLGMYNYYPTLDPSPDYQYADELDVNVAITLPYGGYLSRTRGCYDMDISRLVQDLIADAVSYENIAERSIMLAPSYAIDLYGQREVMVDLDDLTVDVTYTLLR